MENFKHIWTTLIGCLIMLASAGVYFWSFFEPLLRDVCWKHVGIPFVIGLYLVFAKDDDILAPLKALLNALLNAFVKKQEPK